MPEQESVIEAALADLDALDVTLSFPSAAQAEAVPLGGRLFKKDLGFKTGRWKYHVLVDGKLVTKDLPIDLALLDATVKSSNEMMGAGVDVPMPPSHDTSKPKENMGHAVRFFREPDPDRKGEHRLMAIVEAATDKDAEAFREKIRNVSVNWKRTWKDHLGRAWNSIVRHIAPELEPAMHGQEPFVALSAPDQSAVGTVTYGGSEMEKQELEVKLQDLQAKLDAAKEDGVKLADAQGKLAAAEKTIGELRAKYEPPAHVDTPEEVNLKDQLEAERKKNRERASADAKVEVDVMLKDGKIVATKADLARALLSEDEGDIKLSDKQGDKTVDRTLSRGAAFREFVGSLPKGAAFAGRTGAGWKPEPLPAEGDVELRDKQAKRAREIAAEKKCTLAEAQQLAEVELRDQQ